MGEDNHMGRAIFPNQRTAIIHRDDISVESGYTCMNNDSVLNAIRRLNGKHSGAFQLWMVLCLNRDGYRMAMSAEFLHENYGIGKDAYLASWKVLEQAGFLVRDQGNAYHFFEFPEEHLKSGETQLFKSGEYHLEKPGIPAFKSGEIQPEKPEIPAFKSGETPPERSIIQYNTDNSSCCRCSEVTTTTTTTTTSKEILKRFNDQAITEAYKELLDKFGEEIVSESLLQAWEGGPQKRNLRYIKGTCEGKVADRERYPSLNMDPDFIMWD